jgi:hypothetical protein
VRLRVQQIDSEIAGYEQFERAPPTGLRPHANISLILPVLKFELDELAAECGIEARIQAGFDES